MMKRGFTLIELSVVLAVLSVVMAGGLSILTVSLQQTQYDETVNKIHTIKDALLSYSTAFSRLPCPSSLTAPPTNASYGAEVSSPGSCSGANYTNSGVAEGGVPTRVLQLPDTYMYDAWGRRLRYAVDTSFTYASGSNAGLPAPIGGMGVPSATPITVKDAAGAARVGNAVYVILSHGANGHGAFTKTGSQMNGASNNTDEWTNCHCDGSIVSTGYSPTYIQHSANYQTAGDPRYRFDDIVSFAQPWQLASQSSSVSALSATLPNYIFLIDYNNSKFWKYNANTKTWSNPTVAGLNNPQALGVDSSGNIYIGNDTGSAIYKYTNSTATWAAWSVTGVSRPSAIIFDTSGHIYISNYGGNNITEYNSSGGSPIKTLTDGFTGPQSIALDGSGNLWVADSYVPNCNNLAGYGATTAAGTGLCIAKYNGTSWTTIGKAGTGQGQFYEPQGLYVDANQVLWVADYGNNRIQKCSLSTDCSVTTNWTVYGGTSTGTAAGQFNTPSGIWGDAQGNIWVADGHNRRLQVFWKKTQQWDIFADMTLVTTQSLFFSYPIVTMGR
ncbi:MAG TPA: NHL repeat-containing protein [Rickettsiales bacterium]|nr:NHL repeat-containing protein [Rickettsiales bacterium]